MSAATHRALPAWLGTAAAVLLTLCSALFLLREPLSAFDTALWGPDQPWVHRDFLGAWWLFHAAADPALDLSLQNHPRGAPAVQFHIPNPWDAWLLGPLLVHRPAPLWWNSLQLAHHLGNLLAALAFARQQGVRGLALGAAGVVCAATPLMLHEIAGGRTLSGVVWPGLLALALLPRARGLWSGLLIGIQGLCYIYTGLFVGLVALLLCPGWGLLAAALPLAPYLWWLAPVFSTTHSRPPPADYSVLPVLGALGHSSVPARQRLLPLLLPAGVVAALLGPRDRRWKLAAALGLGAVLALGPTPGARGDTAVVASPLAWLIRWVPGLGRMHHPVRAGIVLVPMLATALTLALQHMPRGRTAAATLVVGLALGLGGPVEEAAAHSTPRPLPGVAQALYLREHAVAVTDLTGSGAAALGLQPLHGRPMLEGLRRPQPQPGPHDPGQLRRALDRLLGGDEVPGLAQALSGAGISHVLAVPRVGGPAVPIERLEAAFGPPVYPGVWSTAR